MTTERLFVGKRLTLIRSYHQLTLKSLAETVSASVGLIGHFENGLRQPRPEMVAALASALSVEPPFFYEDLADEWLESQCSFRRRVSTPETVKRRARAHGTLIGLVVAELTTGGVGKSKIRPPQYDVPSLRADSDEAVDRASEHCREYWNLGLGPVPHIGRVAEGRGVLLVQHLQHADVVDAFARRGEVSVIVLNTARLSRSRWIFDVAHELGHFVLHEGIATGSEWTEEQANYFAGALLLPRRSFGREFRTRPFSWPHVFGLKERWHASAAAIVRRAFNLKLIDAVEYRRAYQYMSVKGWLKGEPAEPLFVGPEWLVSAFELLRERYGETPADVAAKLHFTPWLFTEVTGIEAVPNNVRRFRLGGVSSD